MDRLAGKLCVVTGAAHGIGGAISRAFAQQGADVVLTDIDEEGGAELARELGGRFKRLDVTAEADWVQLGQTVPLIDVMVNNAGVTGLEVEGSVHDPEHASLADWQRVHRINLDGTFLGCRYAIGAMKTNGKGSIINLSSVAGITGTPQAAAYGSSKAAIRNLTKTVARYCAQQGWEIRCNSIHPAATMTTIWDPVLGHGADRQDRIRASAAQIPFNRFGTVEEIAAVAVFLAADEATFTTGAEITADGGVLAG